MNFRDCSLAYNIIKIKSFNITAKESLIAAMFTEESAEYFVNFFKKYNIFSDKILYNSWENL